MMSFGLLRRKYTRNLLSVTGSPFTVTKSCNCTRVERSVTISPLTFTIPAVIYSSTALLAPIPASARYLLMRTPSFFSGSAFFPRIVEVDARFEDVFLRVGEFLF